jgi:hypothetical protein
MKWVCKTFLYLCLISSVSDVFKNSRRCQFEARVSKVCHRAGVIAVSYPWPACRNYRAATVVNRMQDADKVRSAYDRSIQRSSKCIMLQEVSERDVKPSSDVIC